MLAPDSMNSDGHSQIRRRISKQILTIGTAVVFTLAVGSWRECRKFCKQDLWTRTLLVFGHSRRQNSWPCLARD